MSTSDQRGPLTRKQLREIRLTGSTPIISEEEAKAAADAAAEAAPPSPPVPRAAEPVVIPPAPVADAPLEPGAAPLTRRQARAQERIKTASVPLDGGEEHAASDAPRTDAADETSSADEIAAEPAAVEDPADIVSGIPDFTTPPASEDDDEVDDEVAAEPVPAAHVTDTVGDVPLGDDAERPEVAEEPSANADTEDSVVEDLLTEDDEDDEDDVDEDERPTVSPAFGRGVLQEDTPAEPEPFRPSFDELLTSNDSGGAQHSAPNALIFTPSPGEGSLSGPVASTGEILVTGSYELPKGLGSQGHAHGTTDGKEVDAVLIDGELPPASSPTPIAASSAVSTIKPAGEVIRPPAPEKGNRLMLIAAIIAGALALGLGTALVLAITGNVF